MTSFPLYPHSHGVIPFIHHQNIPCIHLNNSYHHHYLIYLVSRSTHLATRFPLYIILYSTSFISMTSFPLYPHSYRVIPINHHQNIHRIHQNNSYHHHYLIYLVSRSTHLGTRYPIYIILYSTSFISMTSFPLYPHSHGVIPFIHHQNIPCIHLNNSYHHHYLIYLVSRSTHLATRFPLYIILYSTSFISMTSFPLYPHSHGVIPFMGYFWNPGVVVEECRYVQQVSIQIQLPTAIRIHKIALKARSDSERIKSWSLQAKIEGLTHTVYNHNVQSDRAEDNYIGASVKYFDIPLNSASNYQYYSLPIDGVDSHNSHLTYFQIFSIDEVTEMPILTDGSYINA